jgi:hypothetical protein
VPWGRKALGLVAAREVAHVARVGRSMTERIVTTRVVSLPVRVGERLGEVRVFDRGKLVAAVPLVADRSISRPDALGRVGWYATRTLDHIWGWFS